MTPTMPLHQLKMLDICHHIHKQAEEIYLTLSALHLEQREIARMWGELAIDKCNHADAFRMAGKLRGAILREIKGTPESAGSFLEKTRRAAQALKKTPLSPADALVFTIKMEEGLEKYHINSVATFFKAKDRQLLTSSLKESADIAQIITEHHVNLTLLT